MRGSWQEIDIDVKTKCKQTDGKIVCVAIQEDEHGKRTGFEQTTRKLSEEEIRETEKTF